MSYLLHIFIMISIYTILSLSLNLVVGYAGLLSLCHAAFYGIGAYACTLLLVYVGLPYWASVPLAVVSAAALSFAISIPSLRLRGDYFVLASLGFQIIVFTVLYNWVSVTNGPYGITGIPQPSLAGVRIDSIRAYFVFSFAIAVACALLLYLLQNSPFGRTLKAIREDEVASAALGKNVARFKITAFAVAAAFASLAGVLFAGYMRYLDPTTFTVSESFFILSIIIIGGAGNFTGPILGTVLMVILPEALRLLSIPDSIGAGLRQVIYGTLIILILRFRPQGIFGEYRFE